METFRILVTGSREWSDADLLGRSIERANLELNTYRFPVVVVHGDARGADRIAGSYAKRAGWTEEKHPAQWETYGKRAGYVRNAEMVSLGADVCLAFILNGSAGATMCANLAERSGIPVRRVELNGG